MKNLKDYVGKIYTHPIYGDYTVVEVIPANKSKCGRKMPKIRFLNTGYEYITYAQYFYENSVKDPYVRTIFGVACFGSPEKYGYEGHKGNNDYRCYAIWHAMISRCYNPKDKDYCRYGSLGVRVCDSWLCFENFYRDFCNMEHYEDWLVGERYELDKDALQKDVSKKNMIYSPETTALIPKYDNIALISKYNNTTDFMNNRRLSPTGYAGVIPDDYNNYRVKICIDNSAIRCTFDDPYYGAIYHDAYMNHYGRTCYNDVPIDYNSFLQAQQHRVYNGAPYPYKKMYSLLNNPQSSGSINK